MSDKLMTFNEVMEYLKLRHATLYKLARTGRIPASKIGRLWRFRKDRIDKWLRDLETSYRANKAKSKQ